MFNLHTATDWHTMRAMISIDDRTLMQKIGKGDKVAFCQLFEKHGQLVFGYIRKIVGDVKTAEDILQEVWMKLIQTASQIEVKESVLPWLYSVARNLSVDELRRRKKLSLFSDASELDSPDTEKESIEILLVNEVSIQAVKKCLEHLPEQQRTALTMWMTEDMSYQDLVRDLQTSLAAVKSLIFRAKQHLSDCVQKVMS